MNDRLRTRLVQMEVCPGKPAQNAARMLEHLASAKSDSVDLVVFPEMAVPGYLMPSHDAVTSTYYVRITILPAILFAK